MSPTIGLPPPDPESCLVHSRVSRFKGGTLLDEDVRDLESHERRVCDPDGYRPRACPRCGHTTLHVHCYPERKPRGESGMPPVVRIVQYICTRSDCGATWRVLPIFLARHLWRVWATVERAVEPTNGRTSNDTLPIPEQTRRRWRARLKSSARILIALLAARGGLDTQELAARVEVTATRAELVETYADRMKVSAGNRLAGIAMLAHQLERGVRLM